MKIAEKMPHILDLIVIMFDIFEIKK